MSTSPQLKLVQTAAVALGDCSADPTRRVFEHWVILSGRSIARCKLGPHRRAVINAAFAMGYDEDALLLAIEGMAADPLAGVSEPRIRDAMREVEWLLLREARIERWQERGEALRLQAAQPQPPALADASPPSAEQLQRSAELRRQAQQQLAALARRMREGGAR